MSDQIWWCSSALHYRQTTILVPRIEFMTRFVDLSLPSIMSRLASFRGPSTPSASPVVQARQPISPSSPSRLAESTFHRKLRTYLQEIRKFTQTWDDIVCIDGVKAAKTLIDARTNLEYVLLGPFVGNA
jgi:hypothetical protein